ncbi:hypothetical protein MRX96_013710 [Rhipicephalus microplus]
MYPMQNRDNSPEKWTVDEVAVYISGIPGCERIAEKFRHHEVDGGALFLIKEHHVMTTMNLKLGPALKMCATIIFPSPGVLRRTWVHVGTKLKTIKVL